MPLHSVIQNYLLELEGKAVGRLFAAEGGNVEAEVIKSAGGSSFVHKHIGSVKYQDLMIRCGTGMARDFYDWLGDSLDGAFVRKSGAVLSLDASNKPSARREFTNALITSLEFPKLSASSKDHAYMTVTMRPEMTRSTQADPGQKPGIYVSKLTKAWHLSDFRLKIDGLEEDCRHIRAIGALRMGQKTQAEDISGNVPSGSEYSDLEVSLLGTPGAAFYKWFEDFVQRGKSGPQYEKSGLLQFFAPNATKSYFELELTGLGPYKVDVAQHPDAKTLLPATYTLYCNGMKFRAGPAAVM